MSEKPPPRVLHIGKYLPPVPGGIETYLGDLLRVSMRCGMAVGAIVHEKKGYPKPNSDDFGGAKIYSATTYGQLLYAPVAPSFPWRLREAIRDFKPDILHLHMPNTSVFAALLLPEARKIPWVVHWHADTTSVRGFPFRLAYAVYRPLESAILRLAKSVIATSATYLARSEPLKSVQHKSVAIPLQTDIEKFRSIDNRAIDAARAMWPDPTKRKALAVGRLAPYKGFGVLISAVLQVPSVNLLLVGEGETHADLQSLIDGHAAGHRVRIIGSLDDNRLFALYAAADALCVPSIDRSEAFGLVMLEAAYFGTLVIANDIEGSGVGWVCEYLCGGKTINGDVDGWVEALCDIRFRRPPSFISPSDTPSTAPFGIDYSVLT